MPRTIRVGMAQLAVAKSPDKLETQALGSCIGVVLYDPSSKVGGLSHAMLPDINCAKESSRGNLAKFANTSIDELLKEMKKHGANRRSIKAKLAGGANMFPDVSKEDSVHIGKRNTESARAKLDELGITIIAEETGGSFGRTIALDTVTGKLKVRTIARGEKEI